MTYAEVVEDMKNMTEEQKKVEDTIYDICTGYMRSSDEMVANLQTLARQKDMYDIPSGYILIRLRKHLEDNSWVTDSENKDHRKEITNAD